MPMLETLTIAAGLGCGLEVDDMVRSPRVYRLLRNFRAGIESCISFLKRCFGLARCLWQQAALPAVTVTLNHRPLLSAQRPKPMPTAPWEACRHTHRYCPRTLR